LRCSQPKSGLRNKRNEHDEKLISQVVASNQGTGTVQIIDARPRINARANQVQGAGSEVIQHYANCTMSFEDIDNIHVMRDSWKALIAACNADPVSGSTSGGGGHNATEEAKFLSAVEASGWLSHLGRVLTSANKIAELVDRKRVTVVVHCSDGWDRTPQLTSLAMLILDPYYRTIRGFEVLIEQEWCSFGHQFALRTGVDGQARPNERSPIFIQWLDCVWQLMSQYPCEFEFTERLLLTIADELFACRFGTFLFDNEQQREQVGLRFKTPSLWSWINRGELLYRNALFKPAVSVLQPIVNSRRVRLWEGYFFHSQPELHTPLYHSPFDRALQLVQEHQREVDALKTRIRQLEGDQASGRVRDDDDVDG
jgi:myotubularin-related protein 1/2